MILNFVNKVLDVFLWELSCVLLRVNQHAAIRIILAVLVQSHFQAASAALVLVKVVLEHAREVGELGRALGVHSSVVLVDFGDRCDHLPSVASAAAELKLDHMGGLLVTQDLVRSCRITSLHSLCKR